MQVHRIRGDEANLRVLLKELEEDPDVSRAAKFEFDIVDDHEREDTLRYGPVAEIIVSMATGVASGAALEGIKAAIRRARNRGHIEDMVEQQEDKADDDAGACDS